MLADAANAEWDAGLFGVSRPMPCAPCQPVSGSSRPIPLGIYNFSHPGGVFEVHLRSANRFFAPAFPCDSTWTSESSGKILIDFAKYGKYALEIDANGFLPTFAGSAVGAPDEWRQMKMKRPFTPQETKLMDSEWEFEHAGGHFAIEFRADGLNSCARASLTSRTLYQHPRMRLTCAIVRLSFAAAVVCAGFPAQAFWRLQDADSDTPTVYIDWGKYGKYELKMSEDGEDMAGSAKGQPENWRRASRVRGLDELPNVLKKRSREGCGGCKKGCGECGRGDD